MVSLEKKKSQQDWNLGRLTGVTFSYHLATKKYVNNSVSTKCRLQTGYKMQTRYKMQTADCRLGIKCRLRPKLGINCRLRATLSFRAIGDIFSSLTHPCRVIAFLSSFPCNFLSICIDCEQSMSTDRFFLR